MAAIISMPKLSDTMEEGGIALWLKKEGDFVSEGEILVEIETDKATMEYASPEEGVLHKILALKGASIPLNAPIAVIAQKGEQVDLQKLLDASQSAKSSKTHTDSQPTKEKLSDKKNSAPLATKDERLKASPLAKKMAKDSGLDLHQIQGSGPNGRIVAKDLSSVHKGPSSTPVAAPALKLSVSAQDEKLPLSMMRKTIAKRLLAGKNEAPHFYLRISAHMQNMLQWRTELNKELNKDSSQAKVSVNDLLILACSRALKKHPTVNSSWQDDYILQHGSVHLSFAVALPTGLITPVIPHCDQLGIRDIARLSKELGVKAKDGQLKPEDYQGGTFTISNLGMTEIEDFTAIINPPQACILAVGTIKAVPHVDHNRQLQIQDRMTLTLSCDHRVVDGMVGARFLETLVQYIEQPLLMLS